MKSLVLTRNECIVLVELNEIQIETEMHMHCGPQNGKI